ncbi:hypothetical protein AZE42_13720 [Rhizopogon vesiculosus]|uniref:Uncharacterized protein n=1 Tax=Rhizopogon vesiculosus TaxID=180088 RepID=A0A1J8QB48_9AGAM|nr:hypothetical protein AZE42_13720 [Rhizopogon vesiculosus]
MTCTRYRRKDDVLQLPNLEIKIVPVFQTNGEKVIHEWARSKMKDFDIAYLRARQACDHPLLLMGVLGQIAEEQGIDVEVSSYVTNMYRGGLDPDPYVLPSDLQPFSRLFGHAYVSSKMRVIIDIIKGVPDDQKVLVFVGPSAVFFGHLEAHNFPVLLQRHYGSAGNADKETRDKSGSMFVYMTRQFS